MSKYVLLSLVLFVARTFADPTLTREADFFAIPGLDSLSNQWIIQAIDSTDTTDRVDRGFDHPVDVEIIKLSEIDYRFVVLDAVRRLFTEFRMDLQEGLSTDSVYRSSISSDNWHSATSMCQVKQGTFFIPQSDRLAVTFKVGGVVRLYRFNPVAHQFIQTSAFANPSIAKPVGVFAAFNNLFIADEATQRVFRTDTTGNILSSYGGFTGSRYGFRWMSDISGYVDSQNRAHLYISDGLNGRIDHLTSSSTDPTIRLDSQAWGLGSDGALSGLHECALVPGVGLIGFDRNNQRLFTWSNIDSLQNGVRDSGPFPAPLNLNYNPTVHIKEAGGRLVFITLSDSLRNYVLRSYRVNNAIFDNPQPNPNGHWTTTHSPYYVTASISVPSDGSLTIDPGVTVIFSPGVSLSVPVGAHLVADAAVQARINFQGISSNPIDAWGGLCFYSTSSQNILDWCRLDNASIGVRSRDGGRVGVTNSEFTACGFGALALYGGRVSLSNDTIRDCRYHGAVAACGGANVTITNGSISRCGYTGVWSVASSHIYMSGTSLTENGPSTLNSRNLQFGGTRVTHGSMRLHCIKSNANNGPGFTGLGGVLDMAPNGKNVFLNNLTVPGIRTQINFCSTLPDLCNGRNLICGDNGDLILACNGEFYDEDITGNHWCGNPAGRVPATWTNSGNDADGTTNNRCVLSNYIPCDLITPSYEVFRLAWDQEEVGLWSAAIAGYDSVIKYYPGSKEANLCPDRIVFCEAMSNKDWATQRAYFQDIADTTSEADLKFAARASAAWCLVEMGDIESAEDEYLSLMNQADSDYKYQKAALEALLAELKNSDWGILGRRGDGGQSQIRGLDALHTTIEQENDPDLWAFARIEAMLSGSNESVDEASIPTTYQLYQNYPNPFNPSTEIEFDLPEASSVKLQVFNTLGQIVTTLVNERRAAGHYNVLWNASDVATGLYIYRIEANGFVDSKKMVLMR